VQPVLAGSPPMAKRQSRPRHAAPEGFGGRLARLRRARGLTQEEFAARVGLSGRMVAYYERADAQPPGPLLPRLAQALRVPLEELLGMKPIKDGPSPRTARLLNRLRKIEDLPPADQRAVLKMLDGLLTAHHQKRGA
jgi:transcriptional regulator with XRE-family HTH domain